MLNFYEEIRTRKQYNKIRIGDLLFAEYTCPIKEKSADIWSHTDYLVHVISGKKVWRTTEGAFSAEAGETLFFKKGAAVIEQFFDADFCLLLFFIPDDVVRNVVREYSGDVQGASAARGSIGCALRVNDDAALSVFFQSMAAYFAKTEIPSAPLMKLKLKELILSILISSRNQVLASYFRSLAENATPKIGEIMEENYRYNLSLNEFATLCHRSVSSFKRDFRKQFGDTPGKWLLKKRLEYAAVLLRNNTMNISQIAFESGFEDLSHFSRAFKNQFSVPPSEFRTARK
jgi:AraC-like DNA-binding protein